MYDNGLHFISKLRNDAALFYPTTGKSTGRRGRYKLYDDTIDFSQLDTSICIAE